MNKNRLLGKKVSEHQEQVSLFRWLAFNAKMHPVLDLAFKITNEGTANPRRGAWNKAEGIKKGIPDIFLPVPTMMSGCMQHGLFIEMKSAKGRLSPEQKDKGMRLLAQGYDVAVCYSWTEAAKKIADYLGLPELKRGL